MKKLILITAVLMLLGAAPAKNHGTKLRAAAAGATSYSAALSWTASTSAASCTSPCTFGYNVYRGTTSGGENLTTPLNSSVVTGTTYSDTTVALGNTYYYVVQAVETTGGLTLTSASSNEASVTFPAAPAAPTALTATPQ